MPDQPGVKGQNLSAGFWRILLAAGVGLGGTLSIHAQALEATGSIAHVRILKIQAANGDLLDETLINGPSTPPPGFDLQRQAVFLPKPARSASSNSLTTPAFTWVFGCSAVSGAMIAGYYDRTGYPNMYAGPTNGGVMPLDNSSWPTWADSVPTTYPNCPLIASKAGVDGRVAKGSIDDYWVSYNSTANDPYTGHWAQHTWGTAIGDYMKTSQKAYANVDGSTTFHTYVSSASPLTAAAMVSGGVASKDGTYGRKLFYEARGYTVTECYNQKTDNTIDGGFSFLQFKAEIDAGRPVMLNLAGHTVVGVGYNDTGSTVYLHDTWDTSTHTMTWGDSYSGMELLSVSIVNLGPPPASPTLTSFNPALAPIGDVVTLSGTGFTGTLSVSFNGTFASAFTVDGPTQISVTVPAGATTGKVAVTTLGGTAQSISDFTIITYDLNGDGHIDLKDVARIARYFGTTKAGDPTGFQTQYDLNGDGSISEQDATILFSELD